MLATPQSVGQLVRVMEGKGLIVRTPPAGPGLPSALHASTTGRAVLDEVTTHVLAAFSPEALGLDQAAHDRLNDDLQLMMRTLGQSSG